MKKLEDIEKKNIFEVPERYFDELPLKIQSKTEISKPDSVFARWQFTLKYALPVLALAVGLVLFFKPKSASNVDDLLSAIPSEHLIAYLHESEISEHELLEALQLDNEDADTLNVRVNEDKSIEEINESELKSVLENEL